MNTEILFTKNGAIDYPLSPIDWRELVHDALHSQSALESWHNLENDRQGSPSLIIYDQIAETYERGSFLIFKPERMFVVDWMLGELPTFVGLCCYTPSSPSTFLEKAIGDFVATVQRIDFAEFRSHLAQVKRRCEKASVQYRATRRKAARRKRQAR
jgi:hypothetical protein